MKPGPDANRRRLCATLAAASLPLAWPSAAGANTRANAAHSATPLRIGMSMNNLLSLDPAAATGLDAPAVACNLYDSLLETAAEQPAQLVPGLAQSWQVAGGGRLLRLQLRPQAQFALGRPVTAEHAAWSLQRVLQLNLAPATVWKSYGYSTDNVASHIRAVDKLTLELSLPQATDPQLVLATLATSMSAYVLDPQRVLAHEVKGDLGSAWLTTNAAGSGPFELELWRPKELLILKRAASHWRDPARLQRVVLRHMTESQSLRLMLQRGDLDIAGGLAAPDIKALARQPELRVDSVRRATQYYVALNARQKPFDDPRIRRALLRHLIDFQGLAGSVLPFYGELQQRPVASGLAAALPQPGYSLDLVAARRLLAEAGYAQGFDTSIRVVAEAPFIGIATNLQSTLAAGGVRAQVLPGTGNQVYGAMRERKFDIVVGRGGGGAEAHPHSSLRALAYNPDNRDSARLSNFQGWRTGHADPVLNGLIERALLTADATEQRALYQQAQERFHSDVGALQPLAQVVDTQVLRRAVRGYVGHPSGATRLREVSWAEATA